MSTNPFASAPLITPERLQADHSECFSPLPPWLYQFGLADTEEGLRDDLAILYVGKTAEVDIQLAVVVAAILFELTRFGNSVATNDNGQGEKGMHVRLTLGGDNRNMQTIQRIVAGVGLHQRVELGPDRRDLRVENLTVVSDGKATKKAREVSVANAERLARKAGADVGAYVKNLWALFHLHDALYLRAHDY